jgi:pimeloyl-ACP methyl ester carboxylesterase
MPVLALGARASLGEAVPSQVAQYATTVTGGVIEDCGHWIFEEQPAELAARLMQFLQ